MTASIGVITLNDCNLTLTVKGQSAIAASSGFATLDKKHVLFGEQAQQQAHLQPRVSFNQYWNQLSLDPISNGSAKFRHTADFAYQQLLELHQQVKHCEQIIFCVPASFSREQLALLLGICQQCSFKVVGLIDSALAAISDKVNNGKHLYLDIQLHQCLLSEISVDGQVKTGESDIITGTGLVSLYQHWAKYLTGQFIQQCRFDPMHDAATEQQLYDILPQLLNPTDDELSLTLQNKQIKLNRQSLMRHTLGLFDPVLAAISHTQSQGNLFISERVASIPELSSRLSHAIVVPDDAMAKNSFEQQSHICHDNTQLSLINRLPVSDSSAQGAGFKQRLSHLLWQNNAYPITAKTIYISTTASGIEISQDSKVQADYALQPAANSLTLSLLNNGPLMINGEKARDGTTLNCGDKLGFSHSDESLNLINVLEDKNW
ncbi:MAG: hypothetical protein ACI9FJ_001315 [Alteromonadaceae bacterium]|jgi:hypothetical protein